MAKASGCLRDSKNNAEAPSNVSTDAFVLKSSLCSQPIATKGHAFTHRSIPGLSGWVVPESHDLLDKQKDAQQESRHSKGHRSKLSAQPEPGVRLALLPETPGNDKFKNQAGLTKISAAVSSHRTQ
jgi:hypothetical protein